METKSWNQYSKKEQSDLLQHWWYYYGKMMITLDEWEQFNKLIEKDSNQVLELAVVSYIHGISSQPLVSAMRKNKVDELMLTLPNIEEIKDEKFKTMYKQAENEFISMLVKTYNSPEPSVPMEPEVITKQVKEIVKKKKQQYLIKKGDFNMTYNQEQINKMTEDEKVEIIIKDIQDAIKNKDEKQINGYINDIAQNIKFLMKSINQDKLMYIIIKYLNKLLINDPTIRNNACQNLDENITNGIEEINFEKEALLELRKYLKNSKRTKIYNDLPLSFSILLCIFTMHKERDKKICTDGNIWRSAINGITYVPATQTNNRTDELREVIQVGINTLKK